MKSRRHTLSSPSPPSSSFCSSLTPLFFSPRQVRLLLLLLLPRLQLSSSGRLISICLTNDRRLILPLLSLSHFRLDCMHIQQELKEQECPPAANAPAPSPAAPFFRRLTPRPRSSPHCPSHNNLLTPPSLCNAPAALEINTIPTSSAQSHLFPRDLARHTITSSVPALPARRATAAPPPLTLSHSCNLERDAWQPLLLPPHNPANASIRPAGTSQDIGRRPSCEFGVSLSQAHARPRPEGSLEVAPHQHRHPRRLQHAASASRVHIPHRAALSRL